MDDFYTSMKDACALPDNDDNNVDSTSSIFVEGLVPLNPSRWPPFLAGSAAGSDMPDMKGKLGTPFANVQVAQEYLATAQSDVQYRSRFWQVVEDTITINGICELGGDTGSFAAGAMSNKIADGYVDEMVDTALTTNLNEELNLEIFRATAKEDNRNPETVRGTGTIRQNVPEYMKGDLCDRPQRNERPPEWGEWGDTDNLEGQGPGSGPPQPNDPSEGGSSSGSINDLPVEPNISPDGVISDGDYNEGGVFGRCFDWFCSCFGAPSANEYDCRDLSPYEIERLRKEAEENALGTFSGTTDYLGVDHPAYNPPMCFPEVIPPE